MYQDQGPKAGQALNAVGYFAPEDWVDYVAQELGQNTKRYGRLFLKVGQRVPCYWAQNIWLEPRIISFKTASEAAAALLSLSQFWDPYLGIHQNLCQEIKALLPLLSTNPLSFPTKLPPASGAFTLLDEKTLVASALCTSPFPGGLVQFKENRKDPPSSAYLKLWEALTRMGDFPGPASRCLDAGACPGGWTWVLDKLGAQVLALDRSPLDERLMSSPRVHFRSGNAFAIGPKQLMDQGWDRLEWLCSDLICYPEKLLAWVQLWLASGLVDNYVITLKMQGKPDWKTIEAFAAIPESTVYHACSNKHELTWIRPKPIRALE